MDNDFASATAVATFGVWSVYSAYTASAPKLPALREASAGDWLPRQQLMDADLMVGSMVLLAGVTVLAIYKRVWPIALLAVAFGTLSAYHHAALNGPHPDPKESK